MSKALINGEYLDVEDEIFTPDPQAEIQALKQELASYDYIGVKIAMGVATVEEYQEQIAYTEKLRAKIRELDGTEPLLSADNWREVTPEAKAEIEKQQQAEVMI